MTPPTDKSRPSDIAFCCAYFDFLGGERITQPIPAMFGVTDDFADVLRRHCRIEAHKHFDAKAPAVSFSEAEARQAAEDLRDIAASCCERGDTTYEKILRQLAQKFDTWRKE